MQQLQKPRYEKLLIGLTGTAWVSGLLVAGSDSPYMPWLNGVGLILFFCASVVLGKVLNPSTTNDETRSYPGFCQQSDAAAGMPRKKNQRMNTRYALGA